MHIIIVGAGITGLSSAWSLAKDGHRITLVEQDAIPGVRAASNDHHRLLRHGYDNADGYSAMVTSAQYAWGRLFDAFGKSYFVQTGVLAISREPGDFADRCRSQYDRLGLSYELHDAQSLSARCPVLRSEGLVAATVQPDGGVLLAARILRAIVELLHTKDVKFLPGVQAVRIDFETARVVLEDERELSADRVIVATGAWADRLLPANAEPSHAERQCVVYVEPDDDERRLWEAMPAVVDFGGDSGTYALPPVAGTRMKFSRESHARSGDPDDSRIPAGNEGVDALRPVLPLLAKPDAYRIYETRVCYYSRGPTERYVVHTASRGIALTGCSGHLFKMGAVVGEGLASWATGRVTAEALTAWLHGDPAASALPARF